MEEQKPKVMWSCKGQDFILNRAQDAFVTVQAVNSADCVVQLIVDNPGGDTALESLRAWDKLMSGKAKFLKSNNSFWKMIFERSLGIVEFETKAIVINASNFEIFYDLSEFISEHTISVCGDLENGFKTVRFVE